MKPIFDYSRLRGRIREKCGTEDLFSRQIDISRTSLSKRLNNFIYFSQEEILKACKVLDILENEIPLYFFVIKV